MSEKVNTSNEIAWFEAIKRDKTELVSEMAGNNPELLQAFDYRSFGGTPLTIISSIGHKEMIDLLLDQGADPNRKSDWPMGPWNPVQVALSHGDLEIAQYLATRGAKIGVHEAAGLDMPSLLEDILRSNPEKVNEPGGDGCTALHFAGSEQVVDILLDYGADINARDLDHYSTPAQYLAKHKPAITKFLFDKGAEVDVFSVVLIGDEDRFDQMIKEHSQFIHHKINQDTFPPGPDHNVHNILTFVVGLNTNLLHTAAIGGRLNLMEKLVKQGIDIDGTGGYDDSTALHMAAWRNDLPVTKKLVELGAQMDKRSGKIHNNTPAGWAIVGGSADVFCYLIEQGAEIQDYFAKDIEAGLKGDFQIYQWVPLTNFEKMKEKIR